MGIDSIVTQEESLKAKNIKAMIVNEIDYNVLYTSNH